MSENFNKFQLSQENNSTKLLKNRKKALHKLLQIPVYSAFSFTKTLLTFKIISFQSLTCTLNPSLSIKVPMRQKMTQFNFGPLLLKTFLTYFVKNYSVFILSKSFFGLQKKSLRIQFFLNLKKNI